jgi:hypothetical protein
MNFEISYTGNLLTLVPGEELQTNSEYSITILKGVSGLLPPSGTTIGILDTDFTFWFTTTYCPLFTTLNRVKLLIGPLADSIIDDTIYRMVHKNSLDAIDLYGVNNNTVIAYDYWGCDWVDVPTLLRRYVECKTAYDILALLKVNQSMGSLGGGGGDQSKTLGDMSIKYGGSSNSSGGGGDPKLMKDLYDCWNEQLRMFRLMRATVKGYYDTSKGYLHPVRAIYDNRIIRPVIPHPEGNYTPGTTYIRGI